MIRPFEEKDFTPLLVLADEMRIESKAFQDFTIDHDKLIMIGEHTINHPDVYYGAVATNEKGVIVGFILGFCTEHYFTTDKIANDLAVYVLPEFRGGSSVMRLIKGFTDWARSQGAKSVSLGISTGIDVERTAQLYEALGFKRDSISCKMVL